MAGIIGSMLKKRADNNAVIKTKSSHDNELPSHTCNRELKPFPQYPPKKLHPYASAAPNPNTSEAQTPSKFKKVGVSALKASFGSKDWTQMTKQMETPKKETKDTSKRDDGSFETNPGPSYSAIYIGLVVSALGLVISFVGLGDKGFKTTELRLIGPVLCVVGLSSVVLKIIQCNFPRLFQWTNFLKKTRKKVDQSSLVEKGVTNGHVKPSSNKSTPQAVPHRVTLHSSKRPQRPTSTIPNYIEDTSEDDDFDPGRSKAHTNPYSSYEKRQEENKNEILLTPKSLML